MDSITLTADLEALARISAFITAAAERAGLDERATWQVQLAVDEAATNVIQHAYDPEAPGDITLSWRSEGNQFIVTLRDFGRQFDPGSIPPPDLSSPLEERQAGGLGIYLITRLMDEVRFDFNPQGGNMLTMIKYIAPASGDDTLTFPVTGRVDAATAPSSAALCTRRSPAARDGWCSISAGCPFSPAAACGRCCSSVKS